MERGQTSKTPVEKEIKRLYDLFVEFQYDTALVILYGHPTEGHMLQFALIN